jgi:hypothetical protein
MKLFARIIKIYCALLIFSAPFAAAAIFMMFVIQLIGGSVSVNIYYFFILNFLQTISLIIAVSFLLFILFVPFVLRRIPDGSVLDTVRFLKTIKAPR